MRAARLGLVLTGRPIAAGRLDRGGSSRFGGMSSIAP